MDHDDFDQEPIRGLAKMLPPGERILWQGRPSVRAMARDVFKTRWVGGYFLLLFAWVWVSGMADATAWEAFRVAVVYLIGGAVVVGLLWACAWAQAMAAVYTITTARVAMRTGAALTVHTQYPFRWIGAADLSLRGDGSGTIALRTLGETKFSYLMLWPHARPWRMAKTQPALRCVADAAGVARLLAEAVDAADAAPVVARAAPAPRPLGAMPVPAE